MVCRIDPRYSANDLGGQIKGKVDVFGPNRSGQSIAGIVGQSHRLLGRSEGRANQNGSEDLFLHQSTGRIDFGDEGRGIKASQLGKFAGSDVDRPPFLEAIFDQVGYENLLKIE